MIFFLKSFLQARPLDKDIAQIWRKLKINAQKSQTVQLMGSGHLGPKVRSVTNYAEKGLRPS